MVRSVKRAKAVQISGPQARQFAERRHVL